MSSLLLTDDAQEVVDFAINDAKNRHNQYVDLENLLLGLLEESQREPLRGIQQMIPITKMRQQVAQLIGMIREDPLPDVKEMTAALKGLLGDAANQARAMDHKFVNSGHLWLAMCNVGQDDIRNILRDSGLNAANIRLYIEQNSPSQSAPAREVKMESLQERRERMQAARSESQSVSREIYIVVGIAAVSVILLFFRLDIFISFWLVMAGWVVSVSVHEFAHALVAYIGGDYTVKEKGYLTMNPLKYTHPLLSIGLPLMFLALGGIGLPGGAVYIERHRLRSKWWGSAVSFAGPCGTAIMAIIFAAPFWTGMVEFSARPTTENRLWWTFGFLAFLQVTALFFNLLPLPPLDGFGVLEPLLPPQIVYQLRSFGLMTLFLIFFMFNFSVFADPFWDNTFAVTDRLGVPVETVVYGLDSFRFWR